MDNQKKDEMVRVVVESPFAGDVALNKFYAEFCVKDCLQRGEAPFASHLFFTQVLDDGNTKERQLGIKAGFKWGEVADKTVVYTDLGISKGMQDGINEARRRGREVINRTIPGIQKKLLKFIESRTRKRR
jgi:hypothetical protein